MHSPGTANQRRDSDRDAPASCLAAARPGPFRYALLLRSRTCHYFPVVAFDATVRRVRDTSALTLTGPLFFTDWLVAKFAQCLPLADLIAEDATLTAFVTKRRNGYGRPYDRARIIDADTAKRQYARPGCNGCGKDRSFGD